MAPPNPKPPRVPAAGAVVAGGLAAPKLNPPEPEEAAPPPKEKLIFLKTEILFKFPVYS